MVATPPLADPNFDRSVVFLFKQDSEGAAGVIINRPTAVAVAEALPGWEQVVAPPAVLFGGGPVGDGTGVALGVDTAGNVEIVDLNLPPAETQVAGQRVRIFLGFSAWGPGQLEAELGAGAWVVADAEPGDLLTTHPRGLWRQVLRRQGGHTAWLANVPLDPAVN